MGKHERIVALRPKQGYVMGITRCLLYEGAPSLHHRYTRHLEKDEVSAFFVCFVSASMRFMDRFIYYSLGNGAFVR